MANGNGVTERPNDVHTTIRLPVDLHSRLVEIARKEDRSVSAEARRAITAYVDAHGAETTAA